MKAYTKTSEKANGTGIPVTEGMIVISLAGRDKGRCYVAASLHDGRVYVADGKRHKLMSPKAKNPKHISPIGRIEEDPESLTDKKLRRLISAQMTQLRNEATKTPYP